MPNSSNQDDDDASLNVVPDDDQQRSCCVPANFNVHSKCIFGLCKYINLNAIPVGEREGDSSKNFLGRTNFQRSRRTKWRSLRVGVARRRQGSGRVTFGQCPAWPGEALVGLRGSFRMPLGRPM